MLAARVGAWAGFATVLVARVGAQAGFAMVLAVRVVAQADGVRVSICVDAAKRPSLTFSDGASRNNFWTGVVLVT